MNGVTLKGHGLSLLSESGLYKVIMRSDKAEITTRRVSGNRGTGVTIINELGLNPFQCQQKDTP